MTVAVEGLDELRKTLKKLGNVEALESIKAANKAAGQDVVDEAQSIARGVSKQAAKASQTLRATNTAKGAAVKLGTARTGFELGAEFGAKRAEARYRTGAGRVGKKARLALYNQTKARARGDFPQFMAYRGNGATAGYFMYPAIRKVRADLIERYGEAIEKIFVEKS